MSALGGAYLVAGVLEFVAWNRKVTASSSLVVLSIPGPLGSPARQLLAVRHAAR